jgi:predicted lipoprotein with Yx(FWY)xxD motif
VSIAIRPHSASSTRRLLGVGLIFGAAAITVAACGSSAGTSSGSSSPAAAGGANNASSATGASNAGTSASTVTVSAKNVAGLGTVLVNQQGRTLYMLTTEKGGKITCTASSGCLHAWPEINLPSGTKAAKAGTGVKSSLLGTVKGGAGKTEVTYNGWPLYTFIGDSSAGSATGQGITNFGGTWYVLNTAGNPVTTKAATGGSGGGSSPSSGSGGGAYGY